MRVKAGLGVIAWRTNDFFWGACQWEALKEGAAKQQEINHGDT